MQAAVPCGIIAALVGFAAFSAGILVVALVSYLRGKGPDRPPMLKGWTWLERTRSSLSENRAPRRDGRSQGQKRRA